MEKNGEREKRLAEALRANLRRRKAQQRGASADTEDPSGSPHPPASNPQP
jgi:hypothetical protein